MRKSVTMLLTAGILSSTGSLAQRRVKPELSFTSSFSTYLVTAKHELLHPALVLLHPGASGVGMGMDVGAAFLINNHWRVSVNGGLNVDRYGHKEGARLCRGCAEDPFSEYPPVGRSRFRHSRWVLSQKTDYRIGRGRNPWNVSAGFLVDRAIRYKVKFKNEDCGEGWGKYHSNWYKPISAKGLVGIGKELEWNGKRLIAEFNVAVDLFNKYTEGLFVEDQCDPISPSYTYRGVTLRYMH